MTSLASVKTAISLEHVFFSYGTHPILKDVSLRVKTGEFLCLVGESGSGKTTILRNIAGLVAPTKGKVEIEGAELHGTNEKAAMVFQSFGLFPWLSVYDNIAFPYDIQGREAPHELIMKSITEVGLAGYEQRYPRDLSGGQRQRVGIARALSVQREILLLDEPFSALDIKTATELRRDLAELCKQKGLTVVMVSHLVEEAIELADRILIIRNGEITSTIDISLKRPRDQESAEFLALARRITGIIEE